MVEELRDSVVFIDMDRTLLEGPFVSVVFPQILGELALKTGIAYGALLKMAREENYARLSNLAYSAVQAMDWDDIFAQMAQRLEVDLQTSAVDLVQTHAGPPFTVLNPGVYEVLEQLASPGIKRARVLATKGLRKYQLPVLKACHLLPYFDEVITPDSYQSIKQSFDFYGPWPRQSRLQIMVGDLYEDDVVPAHRFGFKTVWCTWKDPELPSNPDPFSRAKDVGSTLSDEAVRPDAIIVSLFELPQVVERLERQLEAPK